MDSGGYLNDTTQTPYDDTPNRPKSQYTHRERGGLIPITSHILNSATVTQDETVEYKDVQLGDIILVGYITDYKEFEARVKITIWDQTGSVDITFYNNSENQDNSGLSDFYFDGQKKVVKIFGTVKVYKKEKNVQGAKIVLLKDNDIFHHTLQVINSWLYLTGKIQELKKGTYQNDIGNARDIARNAKGNFNNNNFNNNNFNNNNNYNNNFNNNINKQSTNHQRFYSLDKQVYNNSNFQISSLRSSYERKNINKNNKKKDSNYRYKSVNQFPSDIEYNEYNNENDNLDKKLSYLLIQKQILENSLLKLPIHLRSINEIKTKKEINSKISKIEEQINQIRTRIRQLNY